MQGLIFVLFADFFGQFMRPLKFLFSQDGCGNFCHCTDQRRFFPFVQIRACNGGKPRHFPVFVRGSKPVIQRLLFLPGMVRGLSQTNRVFGVKTRIELFKFGHRIARCDAKKIVKFRTGKIKTLPALFIFSAFIQSHRNRTRNPLNAGPGDRCVPGGLS